MTNYGGPVDPKHENLNGFDDNSADSVLFENDLANDIELPPWTDPPTGEIPKVLSELDGDKSSQKFRNNFSKFEDTFTSGSLTSEEVPPGKGSSPISFNLQENYDAPNTLESTLEAPETRFRGVEGLSSRRSKTPADPTKRMFGSGPFEPRTKGAGEFVQGDSEDDIFLQPEEMPLPTKRLNISVPSVSGVKKRKRNKRNVYSVDRVENITESTASDDESESMYVPASFQSRKERLYKAREKQDANRSQPRSKSMPISRILTGVGLAAVVLMAFHLGTVTSMAVVSIAIVLAVIEFYDTVRQAGFRPAALLGIAAVLSLLITTYVKGSSAIPFVFAFLVVASMLWYMVGIIRGEPTLNISVTFLGVVWIGGLGSFAAAILRPQNFPHSNGIAFLLGAIIVTVANDTSAFFVGSWIGKHKLAPEISPTKSWEGFIAGAVASVVIGGVVLPMISPWTVTGGLLIGIIAAVVAPLGDLSESMIKRDLHIKDMGKLLPGHGGMMDRIDGLLFVLPAAYYLLKVMHLS